MILLDTNKSALKQWQIPVGIACVILGILVAIQFRVHEREENSYSSAPIAELVGVIEELEEERNKLQAELLLQREQLHRYEEVATEGQSLLKALSQELLHAKLEAGLIPVKGEGIIVTLKDSTIRPAFNEDTYFFLIHDVDLRSLITELWSSGAEAISINDQRVISTTTIRCVGPAILVNTQRLLPPYEVKAIGPSEKLETALTMQGGFMDSMALSIRNGVTINIAQRKEIRLPAYSGALIFQYAVPDKEGE